MSQRGMAAALGISSSSGMALKSLVSSRAIASSTVGGEILERFNKPLIFKDCTVGGKLMQPRPVHGHNVAVLIDICNALIEAESLGKLSAAQARFAVQAKILVAASAKSGIQNLVYRITGYDASKEEIVAAFRAFVRDEAKRYEKEFPSELYLAWAKLYDISAPLRGRSWKHRHLTIDHVYWPLAKSNGHLLELLKEARALDGCGKKIFQFLTEVGTRALRIHLGRLLEMAQSSSNKTEYEEKFLQRFGGQMSFSW